MPAARQSARQAVRRPGGQEAGATIMDGKIGQTGNCDKTDTTKTDTSEYDNTTMWQPGGLAYQAGQACQAGLSMYCMFKCSMCIKSSQMFNWSSVHFFVFQAGRAGQAGQGGQRARQTKA